MLTPRRYENVKRDHPAPNQYAPRMILKNVSPSWSIGNSKRPSLSPNKNVPSPLEYQVEWPKTEKGQIKFASSLRPSLHTTEDTPPPGTYKIPSTIGETGSFSILPRRNDINKVDSIPAPSAYTYDTNVFKTREPAWKISPALGTKITH